ncbi:hypothetical protein GQ602_007392 [Ophiocordyceps camponoti-floridani]|uniref:Uncharacterized protein n=1 Tax=Ophiocordyceps camponoti-floridani TaxID=2030778 RepID=A0A8H4VB10_9HYPO|nr:hypothetical protein GQ602_007392 [Ophiocordyceps camponoti-floridani]
MFHTLHCPRCRAWLYCPGRVGASAVQPPDPWRPFVPGSGGVGPRRAGGLSHPARPRSDSVGGWRLAAPPPLRSIRGNCATLTPPGRRVAGVPYWGSQARGLCPGAGPWVNARGGT